VGPGKAVGDKPRVVVAAQRELQGLACEVAREQQLALIFAVALKVATGWLVGVVSASRSLVSQKSPLTEPCFCVS